MEDTCYRIELCNCQVSQILAMYSFFFITGAMGMSNAERQRKFRQNRDNNPEKREKYLKEEKERYVKNKVGKGKLLQQ